MKVLVFSALILCSAYASAGESWPIKLGLSLGMESYSIETKESNSTNSANASFFSMQIIPSVGFFLTPKVLVGAQYTQSFAGEFGVNGVGAYGRYYFLGGAARRVQLDDLSVEMFPHYSAYAGMAYKNLLIGSGDFDVRFNGLELSVGGEKQLIDHYFAQAGASLTNLSSSKNRTGLSIGFHIGLGYNY